MKLTIGEFEVEVKAKKSYHDKNNKKDLEYFLNELVIAYQEASVYNACQGYQEIARDFKEKASEIYDQLKAVGAYKPENK